MRIEDDTKLDYQDVLIRPKRSTLTSRKEVDITRTFTFPHSKQTWTGIPIMASNMDTTGTIEIAEAIFEHQLFTCLHKFYSVEDIEKIKDEPYFQNIAVTIGIKDKDLEFLRQVVEKTQPKFVCIDVANGYTERFAGFISQVRSLYPNINIIAGNVVTGEMVEQLILAGADIVKVGIGPGSACTTRKKTGVGYPQLSAVIECADAAHGMGGMIIADGGCVVPGDVAKAFGAGADFVMLGGMFAGHDESGGEVIEENGKKYKEFYGMSSDTAMKKYYGGVAHYRSSEGRTVRLLYRGPIHATIDDILGGLRSCCTYIGAKKLKHVPKCTTFMRVTRQLNTTYEPLEFSTE